MNADHDKHNKFSIFPPWLKNHNNRQKNSGNLLPPPSGRPALETDGVAFDGVESILETEASGLLNIQSVAFSTSPPYRTIIST